MKSKVLCAVVFLLGSLSAQSTYTESVIYSFGSSPANGFYPVGGLVMDKAGNFYGTTQAGGNYSGLCNGYSGCGIVFKVDPAGNENILHSFSAGSDGAVPNASLTLDALGNLYGTTLYGGLHKGTVFKITPAGKYSILHTFGRVAGDGSFPMGPLTVGSDGNLYGMTSDTNICGTPCPQKPISDSGAGVIFKLTLKGAETILYTFPTTQGSPVGNLLRDGLGNLYGASFGGSWSDCCSLPTGGMQFKLNSQGVESTIYTFCSLPSCDDGLMPMFSARSAQRNFYAELYGSNVEDGTFVNANGAIAQVTPKGVETLIHVFGLDTDANSPAGPLLVSGGNIFGTASGGGPAGGGIVYELSPAGVETVIYSFPQYGGSPQGGVIADSAGNLYGTTAAGGTFGGGTVSLKTRAPFNEDVANNFTKSISFAPGK